MYIHNYTYIIIYMYIHIYIYIYSEYIYISCLRLNSGGFTTEAPHRWSSTSASSWVWMPRSQLGRGIGGLMSAAAH